MPLGIGLRTAQMSPVSTIRAQSMGNLFNPPVKRPRFVGGDGIHATRHAVVMASAVAKALLLPAVSLVSELRCRDLSERAWTSLYSK